MSGKRPLSARSRSRSVESPNRTSGALLAVCPVGEVGADSVEQVRTSVIMRFSQPHDHSGSPCLLTHHPRSPRAWPRFARPACSKQLNRRTCSPIWLPSPTRGSCRAPASAGRHPWARRCRGPRGCAVAAIALGPQPQTRPGRSMPRSASVATRSTVGGPSPPRPRSAAPSPGWTPRPSPPRSARGSPTVTTQASGLDGGRSRSTARRYAAPKASRSTCSPRWTTPLARCSPAPDVVICSGPVTANEISSARDGRWPAQVNATIERIPMGGLSAYLGP